VPDHWDVLTEQFKTLQPAQKEYRSRDIIDSWTLIMASKNSIRLKTLTGEAAHHGRRRHSQIP
jgi:hypothetical protein